MANILSEEELGGIDILDNEDPFNLEVDEKEEKYEVWKFNENCESYLSPEYIKNIYDKTLSKIEAINNLSEE